MNSKASFPPVVIRASAGTGKTYQLANRFLALLTHGAEPDQILATTFTRKAAGEIFDRVLLRLAQAATDDAIRADLGQRIGRKELPQAECEALLHAALRNMHRLRIGTLDSYFGSIASMFALELGLPAGWSICDEQIDGRLREEAIEAVLDEENVGDLLNLMHLLAKGEVKRGVSALVFQTVASLYKLSCEAPEAAWKQLPKPKPLTSEQLAAAVLQLESLPLPAHKSIHNSRTADLQFIAGEDWISFISKGIASKVLAGDSTYYGKRIEDDARQLYQQLIEHARGLIVSQLAWQTEATWKLLDKFDRAYRRLKHERRTLRFDDITLQLAAASDATPLDRLAFRLDAGLEHLLLDEFQDTSLAQWQVLRPVARQMAAGKWQPGAALAPSFFCVGDVKQAIYGWRGGVAEIFDGIRDELPALTTQALDCSYRSSPSVIEATNLVFSQLDRHPNLEHQAEFVAQWQAGFPLHSTAKTELPGYVELRTAPEGGEDEDANEVLQQFAAEEVARLAERLPDCTIGVLVRQNKTVARLIFLLRKLHVAASEEGGNPLTDSAAVEVILSLFRVADHPGDTVARFHLAHSPLAVAIGFERFQDNLDALRLARNVRRRLLDEGYGATVFHYAQLLAPACSARDQSRLQQLVELAYQYQPQSTLRSDDFVQFVTGKKITDPSSARVRVMTIHQSKGLEFDVVVLPELQPRIAGQSDDFVVGRPSPTQNIDVVCRYASDAVQKLLPPQFQKLFAEAERQDIHESLCMLYVAMTRAVHALHMIVPFAKATERSIPKTWAGLLRSALAPGLPATPATVLWQTGDANWDQHRAKRASESPAAPADETFPPVKFAPPLAESCRNLERKSPSSLEGGETVPAARLFESSDPAPKNRGTLFHAWLEQAEWLDDALARGVLPDELLRQVARELASEIGVVENLDAMIAEFRGLVAQPAIAAALRKSVYEKAETWAKLAPEFEVLRERPFAVLLGGEILRGTIDRLVLVRSQGKVIAADIVDFKTDAIAADDKTLLASKTEFYLPQLAAYRRAVAQMWRLPEPSITARIVFLSAGEVVDL
jgi:ATP-dependent exoDNAse (exonuclease V) beta subunit